MNTTTRLVIGQNIGIRTRTRALHITKQGILISLLVVGLLFSAFSVIYIKDLNRRLFIQYQALQRQKVEALIEWGKLLLEQSTLSTQSRIQQIAQEVGMEAPNPKEIVLVNADEMADINVRQ